MAGLNVIDEALSEMQDTMLYMETLVESWRDLTAQTNDPHWLWLLKGALDNCKKSQESVLAAVSQHAKPVLQDLQRMR